MAERFLWMRRIHRFWQELRRDRLPQPEIKHEPHPAERVAPQAPLSWAQERMWFIEQMHAGQASNPLASALRIRGELDITALGHAFREVVHRHEPLRTVYRLQGDQPMQVVLPEVAIDLHVQTLDANESSLTDERITDWCRGISEPSFDLADGPVFRIGLLRVAEHDHVLMLVIHHIACDGVSMNLLQRELAQLYVARRAGAPSPLAELPMSYRDYAKLQRQSIQGGREAELVSYWKNRLQNAPGLLDLPTDRPRRSVQNVRTVRQRLSVPDDLARSLEQLARMHGTTSFTVALAAFLLLLGRLAGQKDVVVGIPFAGRSVEKADSLIGLFLNVLVIRTDLETTQTFSRLIAQVRKQTLDAYDHQELPFEKLVEVLQPVRSLAHAPLVQVLFNGVPVESSDWPGSGLSIEPLSSTEPPSTYDLTVYFRREQDHVDLVAVWNPDLFDASRITEMLNQYVHLLRQVADQPGQSLAAISLVTSGARSHLPDAAATLSAPTQPSLLSQVGEIARTMPDAIAMTRGTSALRYHHLWQAVLLVAEHLTRRGVGPGVPVAVTGAPSFELFSSILGVMHSGAAVVPIDPGQPALRQHQLIDQAGCGVLVIAGEVTPGGEALAAQRHLLQVREEAGAIDAAWMSDGARWDSDARLPLDAAYVFFTSGTTGVPKGVIGRHASLSHFIQWQRSQFEVGPTDRVAQVTGISFDVIMREIFLPLTSGACLCIPDVRVDDATELFPWLTRQGVTILHSVPSRLRNWLAPTAAPHHLPGIRWLFMAGEPLHHTLVRDWRSRATGSIVNLYGPTETTLAKSWYRVPQPDELKPGIQCIGLPLPQTQLFILREGNYPCGVGEAGEIVIRTPFRSFGYLGEAETRASFRSNPFGNDPEDLLYFTGDLGRYRADGSIDISGRIDDQVKIGGVRIEPAEVAGALAEHPHVDACHVGASPDANGQKRLVAWVVARTGIRLMESDLRNHLRARLPAVMVPSVFVALDILPLTANGKVDRRLLRVPTSTGPAERLDYVAPRTQTEGTLAEVWSEVLERRPIGIGDDFFASGGHSLLAARLKARVYARFGVDVPLVRFFEITDLAGQAALIEQLQTLVRRAPDNPLPVQVQEQETSAELSRDVLSFGQERLWFLEQLEEARTPWNLSYAWTLRGEVNLAALRRALRLIVERHEPLRTTVRIDNGEPFPFLLPVPPDLLQLDDVSGMVPGDLRAGLSSRQRRQITARFDLAHDLPVRAVLYRSTASEHVLLLTMHHMAMDGTSLPLLVRELAAGYAAFSQGLEPDLPVLKARYADFARWQRKQLEDARLRSLADYWHERLRGLEFPDVPMDKLHNNDMQHPVARLDFVVAPMLSTALQRLGEQCRVTQHMLLLAAFQVLLFRQSGHDDIAVGVPVAGRERVEFENLVGFFVNMLVIRVDLSGNPAFTEVLARVRESSLGAYAHGDMPFEKLVEVLRPERTRRLNPLVNTQFQFLNLTEASLELSTAGTSEGVPVGEHAAIELELGLRSTTDNSLKGCFRYSTDLFAATTIERMSAQYLCLLETIATRPDCPIEELPLLSHSERSRILHEWNRTAEPIDPELTVHGLIDAQALRNPQVEAVSFGDSVLTYRALTAAAGALARRLIAAGVMPGMRVGLMVERSLQLPIGILGVLKSGAVWVPLDPNHPEKRIDAVIRDAGLTVIVTESALRFPLRSFNGAVVELHLDTVPIADSQQTLPVRLSGDDVAYVMYTSGSTGTPKGVPITHGAVVNALSFFARRPGISAADRVLAVTTPTFDISVLELLLPLTVGAHVTIAGIEEVIDGAALSERLTRSGINLLQATPATWSLLLSQGWQGHPSFRAWCGGEALPGTLAAALLERVGELWNFYGPTETTIYSTLKRVRGPEDNGSIGRPIANTAVYVLDARSQPVPVGVPGELWIAGRGVSPGYLNRPDLNVERFQPDPFSGESRARMYRTGDRVRWRYDGELEFLGRVDDQVKLRGFRIEPGEIAGVLLKLESIRQCAVVLREDQPGDPRLVAYLVMARNQTAEQVDPDAMRTHVRQHVPDYMVPSAFLVIDALPLTANGKLDRRALPAPPAISRRLPQPDEASASELELEILSIWREVLGNERVGPQDDFFELGGHSLLALRIQARIRASFGREMPLRILFDARTVAGVAAWVDGSSPP